MNAAASQAVLATVLVFCRIGGCLMLMPGIGSRHIPVRVRLFLALAVALAIVPLVYAMVAPRVIDVGPERLAALILSEAARGALIGLLARVYIAALETLASFIAQAVGVASMPGLSVDEDVMLPPLASLITFTATALIFMSDLHLDLVRGLVDSYRQMPPGDLFEARPALVDLTDHLSAGFLVALQVAGPFVIYAVIMNTAVGIINKFTPQIPVYFIAGPFITAGGLLLFYIATAQMLSVFMAAFGRVLRGD